MGKEKALTAYKIPPIIYNVKDIIYVLKDQAKIFISKLDSKMQTSGI